MDIRRLRHPGHGSGRRRGPSNERGATLVEYALSLSVFVVAVMGVLGVLEDNTRVEVANELDCVSERPPPPSCQLRALTTTTTSTTVVTAPPTTADPGPTTTTSSALPPATTTTSAPAAPSAGVHWDLHRRLRWDGHESISGWFMLTDGAGSPLGSRDVTFEVRTGDGQVLERTWCRTASGFLFDGLCGLRVGLADGVGDVQVVITSVGGTPTLLAPSEPSPWLAPG